MPADGQAVAYDPNAPSTDPNVLASQQWWAQQEAEGRERTRQIFQKWFGRNPTEDEYSVFWKWDNAAIEQHLANSVQYGTTPVHEAQNTSAGLVLPTAAYTSGDPYLNSLATIAKAPPAYKKGFSPAAARGAWAEASQRLGIAISPRQKQTADFFVAALGPEQAAELARKITDARTLKKALQIASVFAGAIGGAAAGPAGAAAGAAAQGAGAGAALSGAAAGAAAGGSAAAAQIVAERFARLVVGAPQQDIGKQAGQLGLGVLGGGVAGGLGAQFGGGTLGKVAGAVGGKAVTQGVQGEFDPLGLAITGIGAGAGIPTQATTLLTSQLRNLLDSPDTKRDPAAVQALVDRAANIRAQSAEREAAYRQMLASQDARYNQMQRDYRERYNAAQARYAQQQAAYFQRLQQALTGNTQASARYAKQFKTVQGEHPNTLQRLATYFGSSSPAAQTAPYDPYAPSRAYTGALTPTYGVRSAPPAPTEASTVAPTGWSGYSPALLQILQGRSAQERLTRSYA